MSFPDLENILCQKNNNSLYNRAGRLPIRKAKLPSDFFSPFKSNHKKSMDSSSMFSSSDENSSMPGTPTFCKVELKREKESKYMRYKIEQDIFKGEELIRDAILTSRNLSRIIRKGSMDLKKESYDLHEEKSLYYGNPISKRNSFSREKSSSKASSREKMPKLPNILTKRSQQEQRSVMIH